ncbi:GPI-anchored protein LLG1 [Impatiens glandulifera]|uniref:GPI-anchored protein LLG1 n=1 Tax=Impatiens glandulifera TaxID=253017 RepID=UPI001FB068BB|nr:GPI-anchored protein LLG1 [Impatiens glandulifera]XP_047334347.1 GPI-anchored protein LLG1 [Impatiens glandulifera]
MRQSYSSSCGLCSSSSLTCLSIFLFLFIGGPAVCVSNSLSDDIFDDQASIGRNLLQAKQACSVNFEFQNYTIITSKCKGPQYPANLCCSAFKEFACPFSAELNDLSNDCASTMFSYINLYGKYPPGLFASQCREGKQGLACDAQPPSQTANLNDNGITIYLPSSITSLLLLHAFLFFFFFQLI